MMNRKKQIGKNNIKYCWFLGRCLKREEVKGKGKIAKMEKEVDREDLFVEVGSGSDRLD